MAKTEELTTSK